jgi:type I restriction enzyme S subunit
MAGEAWTETTIGEQATLQRGIDITKAEQREGKVPVISSGGVSSYHDTAAVKGPGVVLGRKGVVGSVFFVDKDYWPHDTSLWVKDFHGNYPRFVYYFFKSIASQIARMDVGSANPTLNRNHVHPIPVNWPPLTEQKAIASVLGALDDKIELNRRMNATLEAMARALFQSWFVDFDPVRAKLDGRKPDGLDKATAALFPSAFQDSELGPIPLGWDVGSILRQADLLSGGTPKTDVPAYWDGDIPWASAKDVSQCGEAFLISTERTITKLGVDESSTKIIPSLATVVVARGATTGRLTMFGESMAMNQTCYGLRSEVGAPFALYCHARHFIDRLVQGGHGSVFDTITTSTFEATDVLLAPKEVLQAFDKHVTPLFHRVRTNIHQSRSLATLRDTLLPKLLSGELRVRDALGAIA